MSSVALSRRLRSSGLWAAGGRVSAGLLLLAVHGVLGRQLTTEEYGRYVLIESLAMLGAVFCMCGLPSVTLRLMRSRLSSSQLQSSHEVASVSIALTIVASIATGVLAAGWALTKGLPGGIGNVWLPWILTWAAFAAGLRLLGEIFRASDRYSAGYCIGGQSGGLIFTGALLVGCIVLSVGGVLNLMSALWVQVSLQILILTFALRMLRAELAWPKRGGRHRVLTTLLYSGLPLLIQQLVSIGLPEAGKLFLGELAGPEEAGLYNAAFRLVLLGHVPLMIVNNGIQPFITELHADGDRRSLNVLIRGAATLAAAPSLFLLSLFIFVPESVMQLTFGPEFAPAAETLRWLAIGSCFWVLSGSCGLVLMMTGHERLCMLGTIIPGIIYLAITPSLINHFGVVGAAYSSAILQLLSNLICALLVYRHHRLLTFVTLSSDTVRDCIRLITGKSSTADRER